MLLSLNKQADDRKSRLLKLREKRKLEKNPQGDLQTQPILDQNFNSATEDDHNEFKEDAGHATNKSSIRLRNFDLEEREAISGIRNPPTLALSNSETVEVLASQIQHDILQDIKHMAEKASNEENEEPPSEKQESAYYNEDLKADLASYFNKADKKTNQAINKILQTKYQNSIDQTGF